MKARGKVDVQFHSFLVSAFDEDELLASRPGHFTCRKITPLYIEKTGTAVAQWLRRCATNRKVAGSIADGGIGIFH